jgi:nicotinamidase-related amidase
MSDRTASLVIDMQITVVTGMQTAVTRVGDAHTPIDATLSAESIIAHRNAVLPKLAHPRHHILVRPSGDVTFRDPSPP